ncbi:hypothetical protein [Isoptericola sp. NPDC056605]|uniref:hypothetical protein n=1 Tax=Isoptericola sp. NPDC056605 TaxID=3345876 RepID=UPI0036CABCC6
MHAYRVGDKVRTSTHRGAVGTIVRHHPTLPAWIVQFYGEPYPLAYTDDRLRRVADR